MELYLPVVCRVDILVAGLGLLLAGIAMVSLRTVPLFLSVLLLAIPFTFAHTTLLQSVDSYTVEAEPEGRFFVVQREGYPLPWRDNVYCDCGPLDCVCGGRGIISFDWLSFVMDVLFYASLGYVALLPYVFLRLSRKRGIRRALVS